MIILWGLLLFLIIFGAVRLAISPLIDKGDKIDIKSSLSFMRDIGVLSSKEHEIIASKYESNSDDNDKLFQFEKHSKILNEIKELKLMTEPEYEDKVARLKHHFNVD